MSYANRVKILFLLLISVFLFLKPVSFCIADQPQAGPNKRVLIIHSYHHGLAWTDGQDKGIMEILSDEPDIEISAEFLDSKRIALEKISDPFSEYVIHKYAGQKISAIMVTDNSALNFVSGVYRDMFAGTPVIFSGINNFKPEMLREFDGMATGVVQVLEPKGTFDLMMELQPGLERVLVVSGATPTAKAIRDEVKAAFGKYDMPVRVEWLDGLETDDLLARLSKLSIKDAVLLCNFNRDGAGNYYSHAKSGQMISEASNAPVYAMEDHYLGTGIVGGYMNSSKDQGLAAGNICLKVLRTGKIPPVLMESPNVIMFDHIPMVRFGLDESVLPDNAVIINRPVSFYQQNKVLIWNTILAFTLLLMALLGVSLGLVRAQRAERLLKESESKLKVVFNNSYEFMGILDLNGTLIETNRTSLDFGDFKESDVVGKPFWQTPWWEQTPEQTSHLRNLISRAAVGEFVHEEVRLISPDGEIHYIDFSIVPVKDDKGNVLYLVPEGRDFTDRKLAVAAMKESEKKYRTLFEQSADAILIIEDGKFIDCNQATVDMLGYSDKNELLNTHPSELSPTLQPDGSESFEKANAMIEIAVEKGSHRFEWDHKRSNGEVFPVEVLLTSVTLEDKSFIHVVWRDITERKCAEQQREQNRYYLKRAQEIGHLGTWELDLVNNELVWTEENYRIFGIEPGTKLNYQSFLDRVYPDDLEFVKEQWVRAIADMQPYDIEHRIVVDGQIKWVREKAELELDDEGKCISATGFTQDITASKKEEKQREELVRKLEFKNKELQDIVYTASHDLRSPLVNIEGFSGELESACRELSELITREPERADRQVETILDEEIPQCLKFIVTGAKKMASLLDGLLQISRIGTVRIKPEPLDIDRIIREIMQSMEHQIKTRGISVTIKKLPMCIGDAHMIDHVFTNLISNAIKYRSHERESFIKISGKSVGGICTFCVEDNGVGIAADHQKKIFEIFHRLNPEDSEGGEGLGLTIVTRILDRLGGKIWVKSEPGKGSKFYVSLPSAVAGH